MSGKLVLFSSSVFLPLVVLLLAAISPPAQGATAGELLEKAIYAEETVGNLDEAIKLYEQVIAEAKTAKGAAAKAQYRLGLIYEKQGNADRAAEAFRAVIENYPDEKEIVADARKRLPSELKLLAAPWVDGEEMQLNLKLPTGIDIGTMIYRIESGKKDGKDVWLCSTRGLVTANGANSISRVTCDKETFLAIDSFWKHSMLGQAEAKYAENRAEITVKGKEKPTIQKTDGPAFDNEQGVELFRRLPMKVGYKTDLNIVSSLGSGMVKLKLEVPAMETVETPAGKFECFKLELNIGQTFWISNDEHRYVARFAAGGVTADLARVEQHKATDEMPVEAEGVKLTLPAGWRAYAPEAGFGDDKQHTVFLIDRDAVVDAKLSIGALATLNEDEQKSPKAWTESAMEKIGKTVKDFKVRDSGVQEIKLGERTAVAVTADFTQGESNSTVYGIAVFGEKQAVNLRFTMPSEKLDELKPELDAIVNSLKVE